jgi:hypothetical protein
MAREHPPPLPERMHWTTCVPIKLLSRHASSCADYDSTHAPPRRIDMLLAPKSHEEGDSDEYALPHSTRVSYHSAATSSVQQSRGLVAIRTTVAIRTAATLAALSMSHAVLDQSSILVKKMDIANRQYAAAKKNKSPGGIGRGGANTTNTTTTQQVFTSLDQCTNDWPIKLLSRHASSCADCDSTHAPPRRMICFLRRSPMRRETQTNMLFLIRRFCRITAPRRLAFSNLVDWLLCPT